MSNNREEYITGDNEMDENYNSLESRRYKKLQRINKSNNETNNYI